MVEVLSKLQGFSLANLYPSIQPHVSTLLVSSELSTFINREPPVACPTMDPSQMPPVIMDCGSGCVEI